MQIILTPLLIRFLLFNSPLQTRITSHLSLPLSLSRPLSLSKMPRNSIVAAFPRDLIEEVLARVASDSPTPLRDLTNLRRSWWDREKFLDLIRSCAKSGNLEACFVLGLDEFYNKRRRAEGLRHLREAAAGGHRAAAYAAGMLLFRRPSTRRLGIEQLESVADVGGAAAVGKWRREAASGVRAITWKRWRRRPLKRSSEEGPCADRRCGAAAAAAEKGGGEWWWREERERRFCSRECRWRHEYYKFIETI
ncbi:hypothetical protein ACMD2_09508 [Ananas comosus]|uniref:At2g35280-like TPR domain-containing protein n=1 Tax=Ananas comosus TaxID=4615 RepID=A0A199VTD8_ANACO|nr:hypothetical protein ACMD2_09508 [Ananas comosus]